MAPRTSVRLTYDDYAAMPDDGKRYALIEGKLYANAAPATKHQWLTLRLGRLLDEFCERHGLGVVLPAPDVVLSKFDVVRPDLLFVSEARAAIITVKNVQGAPDLAIEILSDSNRRHDEVRKRGLYERAGVGEYWIVDPVIDSIRVYRLHGEAYDRTSELTSAAGDVLESPLFPGLRIELQRLFVSRLSPL
jgi:Uma2 family endonuclease